MVFSSLLFLFFYLPVVLGVYYAAPRRFRNAFLLLANLVFYGWGEPVYLSVMVFSTLSNYLFGLLIEKSRAHPRWAKGWLVCSIVVSLGILGVFKYTGFFAGLLAKLPGLSSLHAPSPALPIGISFYTFQTMSYAIDVYRGDTPAQRSLVQFGTYVSLFPQLIAGPIVRYKDVADQLEHRRENTAQFADGIRLFLTGLSKKVLLANPMGTLWSSLQTGGGTLGSWAGLLAYTLQIYFDFSGYSDMARGLGKMLGFEFMVNFDYPYISKSITEFWRRWHRSLGTWFRDYVYIPLGGNRKGAARTLLNLFLVWFLTGLWHGANVNFILWGLFYFVLLAGEKYLWGKVLKKAPGWLAHGYTMIFVILGWALFYFEDFSALSSFLTGLFTAKDGFLTHQGMVEILSALPLLLIGGFACLPAGRQLGQKWMARPRRNWTELLFWGVLFALCTAALVNQSYNPFLYFRF